jgi:N-methylhydantoinase A
VRDVGSPVEIVSWKARLVISLAQPPEASKAKGGTPIAKATSERDCYFGDSTPVRTMIFKSINIEPGVTITGPAIVEEPTTTLVVYPGMSALVSADGNYLLRLS